MEVRLLRCLNDTSSMLMESTLSNKLPCEAGLGQKCDNSAEHIRKQRQREREREVCRLCAEQERGNRVDSQQGLRQGRRSSRALDLLAHVAPPNVSARVFF